MKKTFFLPLIVFLLSACSFPEISTSSSFSSEDSSSDYSDPGTQTIEPSEEPSSESSASESSASEPSSSTTSSSQSSSESSSSQEELIMTPISFPQARSLNENELASYIGNDVKDNNGWVNSAHADGLIISPYFRVVADRKYVSVYATRTTYGAHSFSMFDVPEDCFPLELTISSKENESWNSVTILPKNKCTSSLSNGKITLTIPEPGNYTVLPDGENTKPLTIFAYKKEAVEIPAGYSKKVLSPGDHGTLVFGKEKTVLVLEKGFHRINRIELKSNCMILFESGAQVEAQNSFDGETPLLNPDWAGMTRYQAFLHGQNIHNVQIKGHAYIDLTRLDWHARLGCYFENCFDLAFEGFALVNSPEWTLELMNCHDSLIQDCSIFGYRQNSDGFAIVDSYNVQVKSCFARSGDDLFEVKTMNGSLTTPVSNIVFDECVGWPDKCRGFGIIHETQRNISDVTYSHITVISAPADWMDALGALVVIVAGNSTISNITFSDVDIHQCSFYPINLTLHEESASGVINEIHFQNIKIPNDNKIRLCNSSSSGEIKNIEFDSIYRKGSRVNTTLGLKLNLTGTIGTVTVK